MRHYSDQECLAKLFELGFDVPPIVLRSWGRAFRTGHCSKNIRTRVEQYINFRFKLKGSHSHLRPGCLFPFDLRNQHRPTAWWTREREERERAEKIYS